MYVLGQFFADCVLGLLFTPGFVAAIPVAIIVLLILYTSGTLSWKAVGRETETSFYLPPIAGMWVAIPGCLFAQTLPRTAECQ